MSGKPKDSLLEMLQQQNDLQRQLIEAQNEVIRLYRKMESLTPPKPETDVHWHQVSGGILSDDVLASDNLEQMRALQNWMMGFGEKYIKPYIHPEVYGEMLSHMTRGLSGRLAELEVTALFGLRPDDIEKTVDFESAAQNTTKASKPRKTKSKKTNASTSEKASGVD